MELFRKKSINLILKQVADDNASEAKHGLAKHLGVRDLTAFGIAAIIGAGIFSTIGQASADGGPGVVFLFLFTAIACSFAAFCYAEFASMVPVSGSAYTYSYVAFGELFAWIIGWALIMEYGIGNITIAISWSDYFTGLLGTMNIHLPQWMQMDYLSASNGFKEATVLMHGGKSFDNLNAVSQNAYIAWTTAPAIGSFHFVTDLPALLIIIFITAVVYRGIKESRNASNLMVVVKLGVVLLVIAVGIFYVDTSNWDPFAPNGVGGILKGVSAVFFAYIGFDAISTTAEECKNPQRDLPRGMMWALIICTVLYIIIALVLTGMVKYDELAVGDPLAFVFDKLHLQWMSGIIAVSAVFAMASVLLVFTLGQPRIWMSMSRDGLLPAVFAKIHPKFKTPSFSTIVTGFVVAVPSLFLNMTIVTNLCSIGTLFAFVLVCGGVLMLQHDKNIPRGKFRTPYLNGKFIVPLMLIFSFAAGFIFNGERTKNFFTNHPQTIAKKDFLSNLNKEEVDLVKNYVVQTDPEALNELSNDLDVYVNTLQESNYQSLITAVPIVKEKKMTSGWNLFKHKIPMWIFILVSVILSILSFTKNLSLIPVLGVLSCLYMMAEIELQNWVGFGIWLLVGLVIYFGYSYKNSKLHKTFI